MSFVLQSIKKKWAVSASRYCKSSGCFPYVWFQSLWGGGQHLNLLKRHLGLNSKVSSGQSRNGAWRAEPGHALQLSSQRRTRRCPWSLATQRQNLTETCLDWDLEEWSSQTWVRAFQIICKWPFICSLKKKNSRNSSVFVFFISCAPLCLSVSLSVSVSLSPLLEYKLKCVFLRSFVNVLTFTNNNVKH